MPTPTSHELALIYEAGIPPTLRTSEVAIYCGVLIGLAAASDAKTIVEIGVQCGLSTRVLLTIAWAHGGTLHSIDPVALDMVDYECDRGSLLDLSRTVSGQHWVYHQAKSQDVTPIACDFLYVDGDHRYETVVSDMARHGRAVRDGGIIVLDDYHPNFPGKMRWVDERPDLNALIIGPRAIIQVNANTRALFGDINAS